MNRPRLTLFEPFTGGHHPEHLYHLVNYWRPENGVLEIATPLQNLRTFELLSGLEHGEGPQNVSWYPLEDTQASTKLKRSVYYYRQLRSYVHADRTDHILLMHIDRLQPFLAIDLRFNLAIEFSGILFRPNFHYGDFGSEARTLSRMMQYFRKRLLLKLVLKNSHLNTIFSLDPFCVSALRQWTMKVNFRALPDPVPPFSRQDEEPNVFPMDNDRKPLLLFGKLTARKGVLELLKACELLPPTTAKKIHLQLAGKLQEDIRHEALERINKLKTTTNLSVDIVDRFIPYDKCHSYFAKAGLIILPYQRHMGMSGILVRAAAAGKPVLSQEYGLIGKMVRHYSLGWTVNTEAPEEIALGLERWLRNDLQDFDPDSAYIFASKNTPMAFAQAIFSTLLV